jgi:hypothetical protein
LSFHLVEEHPLIAMHQRRQSTFDTLVADREETNSRPVDNDRAVEDDRLAGLEPNVLALRRDTPA